MYMLIVWTLRSNAFKVWFRLLVIRGGYVAPNSDQQQQQFSALPLGGGGLVSIVSLRIQLLIFNENMQNL